MAAQSIWNGTISFSLVAIPVRLVTAVAPGQVSFHLLHNKDYSRLARKMYCPADERMVTAEEIIRGYEILPGKYIPMTDEELESVAPERSRTIEISEFIDLKDVDPIYFDRPYYLVPSKGGEKAYQLLVKIMDRTNKAGLAKFVLAEREYLVAVTSKNGALALTTLHYRDDILPDDDLATKGAGEAGETNRMKKNIRDMMADFDPGKYADGRRKKIMALLEAKRKEKALVEAPAMTEREEKGPADLVAALEESMRKVKLR